MAHMRDKRLGVSGGDLRKEAKLGLVLSVSKEETGTQASRLWGSILFPTDVILSSRGSTDF